MMYKYTMTDFQQEFKKLFGNSYSVENYDWTKPRNFDSLSNDCSKAEAALISSLTSEAYNYYRI